MGEARETARRNHLPGYTAAATLCNMMGRAEYDAIPREVALAGLAAQPGITDPIASATNEQQAEELAAADTLELVDASLAKLDAVSRQ